MDIAEVARRSGVPASALRFYEEKGLIASVGRQGLRRTFGPGVLDQLALIALGRAAGFSLDDIGTMFSAQGQPQIDRRRLAAKADEIDGIASRLVSISAALRHASVCKARSHMECPSFQRLLKAASAGAFEPAPPLAGLSPAAGTRSPRARQPPPPAVRRRG